MLFSWTLAAALAGCASSTILWDGRFNDLTSSTDLNNWSWSNQVGPYQYYIHGTGAVTSYVNLDAAYKNPADTGSNQGVKITLDSTAYWNGQTMRRTELIPQTTAAINSGTVWYHFSIQRSDTNAPSIYREHQIAFFESHFTELKSGWISGESGTSDPLLRWDISGSTQWSTNWTAGVWHNVAYEINFSAGSVAFWHSTGSDPLTLTVPAVSVSASSNGADWHLGVLELPVTGQTDTTEDFYFSGVYIESGSLTTSVAGPASGSSSSSVVASSSTLLTSTVPATSSKGESSSAISSVSVAAVSIAQSSTATSAVLVASTSITNSSVAATTAAANTSTKKNCSSITVSSVTGALSTSASFLNSSSSLTSLSPSSTKSKCSSLTVAAPTTLSTSTTKTKCSSVLA